MRVLVFGASITQGYWDTQGGWVSRLFNHYAKLKLADINKEGEYPDIFNLGISADTTKDILVRFDSETKARQRPEMCFLFGGGTNNAREKNGQLFSTPLEYKADLKLLVQKARHYSDKILFVGLAPCDEAKTTPVFWDDIYYRNRNIGLMDQAMREMADEESLPYVPIFEAIQEEAKREQMFADGLHPNDAGHELIFQQVLPVLDRCLDT